MIGGPVIAETPISDRIAFGSFASRLRALVVNQVLPVLPPWSSSGT